MLIYYHGSDRNSIESIVRNGAVVSKGRGELGKGFYIGSSMWRACSWAWAKSQQCKSMCNGYGVIQYKLDEEQFLKLNILCKNRVSAQDLYRRLKRTNATAEWISDNDAIWAPIVGKDIRNVYQIKFESKDGENFINNQKKSIIWQK